jgi:hypothetical protein
MERIILYEEELLSNLGYLFNGFNDFWVEKKPLNVLLFNDIFDEYLANRFEPKVKEGSFLTIREHYQ